jgi:hypothetical protein
MAQSTDNQQRIIAIFQQHFPLHEYRVDLQYRHDMMGQMVICRHVPSSLNMSQVLDDVDTLRLDAMAMVGEVARTMAQRFYHELLMKDSTNNSAITPDPYDPDANAIWALVKLVDGELVARHTPVLSPGEENPWMLVLPRQGKIIPVSKQYFEKPLDWWQRFMAYNTGESQ